MGQGGRVLMWAGTAERLQRGQRHDPGRNRGGEIFAQEGAERPIFPTLDVARAPVINQHKAKDVVGRFVNGHRFAHSTAGADEEPDFQLEVQFGRWAEDRSGRPGRQHLAMGASQHRIPGDNRAGAAVIGNREVQPIGHQRLLRSAEHGPDVGGMFSRRVEIGVVADVGGQ